MTTISNFIFIPLFIIAIILHFLRIIYLLFQPKIFERYKSISNRNPGTFQLIIYYLLTILFLVGAILFRLGIRDFFV